MNKTIVLQDKVSGVKYAFRMPCVIGRGGGVDLALNDASVSHRHARIDMNEGESWIHDLASANGTFVNNRRVQEEYQLKHGDGIRLGSTTLQFFLPEETLTEQTVVLHSLAIDEEAGLDHQRLQIIYRITSELSENHDMKSLSEKIFITFKELFTPDSCYIASFLEDGSLKRLYSSSVEDSLCLSKTIIKRLLASGESLLIEDALEDGNFREQESILGMKIRSALCVPLLFRGQIYGLIYLDRKVPRAYGQQDLEFLRSIGAILAPIIENTRLWSDLQGRYRETVATLRKTEARLLESERSAAYVRLAQAMAHEIRNPLMVMGGMLRRLLKGNQELAQDARSDYILSSLARLENVLSEVDRFVQPSSPCRKFCRLDELLRGRLQESLDAHAAYRIHPVLTVTANNTVVSLDPDLFIKAVAMIFKEIVFAVPDIDSLLITIRDDNDFLEVVFGKLHEDSRLCSPFDPEVREAPWSLGLFLNIAHKILSDLGGAILLDSRAGKPLPVVMKIPRSVHPEYSVSDDANKADAV
jgi:GAF domain-containing protein